LSLLSFAEVHCGAYDRARAHAEQVVTVIGQKGGIWSVGFSLLHLGCVALALGEYTQAQPLLQESVAAFRALGHPGEPAWVLPIMGILALEVGQPLLAEQCLCETLQSTVKIGDVFWLMHVLPAMALFMADRGSGERAVELYALASCFPYVAGSRWFEDVAGRRIAAVAAALPPEVVAAAQERGRARDPRATAAELLNELGT
jgi:hypothetical protein